VGILKKLFQGGKKDSGDPDGIYFYVQCDNCGEKLRLRADKRHDLLRDFETGQLQWNKEVMDGRCFRIMYAHVVLDSSYRVQSPEIKGDGHFISEEEFLARD
jgi:hypothetical protein